MVFCLALFFLFSYFSKHNGDDENSRGKEDNIFEKITDIVQEAPAIKAGKALSNNMCEGQGSVTLTHLPMKSEDFAFLIPYGLMVGGHVTPIDHQYFSPTIFKSPRDKYPVFSMANGKIVGVQHRYIPKSKENDRLTDEYRIVISHTCTFFTYYDLITSLDSKIKMGYELKAGELVGRIGGQTLDFAVWDTTRPLEGFFTPELYKSEEWKIYTANPFDYYTKELKNILTKKNLRTASPIQGKIDYDKDGGIVGNWFLEGTNGYQGKNQSKYYEGHLSIAPEHLDPTSYIISFGDFKGSPKQFTISKKVKNPTKISNSEIIKYDLFDFQYVNHDGEFWDRNSLVQNLKLLPMENSNGCVVFKLENKKKVKIEIFPNMMCSNIKGFTQNFKMYER